MTDQTAPRRVPTRAERIQAAREDGRNLDTARPTPHLDRVRRERDQARQTLDDMYTVRDQLAADLAQARDANDGLALTLAEILGTLTDHSEASVRSTWISTTRVDRWRAALTTAKTTTAASEAEAVAQITALTTELERARDTTQRCWRLFKGAAAERDEARAELADLRDRLATIRQIADEAAAVTGADERGSVYDHPEPTEADR